MACVRSLRHPSTAGGGGVLETHGLPKWTERLQCAPTATVPVIRRTGAGRAAFESAAYGRAAPNECVLLRWGLVPFWCRRRSAALFNIQRPHRAHGKGGVFSRCLGSRAALHPAGRWLLRVATAGRSKAAVSPEAGRPGHLRVRRACGIALPGRTASSNRARSSRCPRTGWSPKFITPASGCQRFFAKKITTSGCMGRRDRSTRRSACRIPRI